MIKPSDLHHQALKKARVDADEFDDIFGQSIDDVKRIYLDMERFVNGDGEGLEGAAAVLTLAAIMASPEEEEDNY